MIANLPWNMANTRSGTPLLPTVLSMLRRNTRPGSQPIQPPRTFGPKASAYPTTTQITPMIAIAAKLCIIVPRTFLVRTRPP